MENSYMANEAETPNISKARILVVDDNPGTAATLARAIARISPNLEVFSATDGVSALEHVQDETIDLVITDMMMPDLNGLELIESLRKNAEGNPIYTILITAYDVPGLKESARRLKVNETLIKPIHPERICQIVRQALEEMQSSLAPRQNQESGHIFRLLIADDNPSNLTLLARYLQQEEYELMTAANGVETLEKTRAEMPDLILLDVNMPEKDGFQVLQEIRSDPATEHIPVIILTAARLDPVDMQFALNLGADDYVTKPFDRRELLARIRTKLRVKEAEDAIRSRNKELSLLPEIGKDLSARLDINELADIVLHRTVETLGALLGHIFIVNSTSPYHKEYRASAITTAGFTIQTPQLTAFLDQFKDTRQGLIINDINDDHRWQVFQDDPTHSVILVPMFGRLELIGVLVLAHEKAGYFNLEHQLLLQAIASQAAIAIENAQLYAGIAQEQQRLAAVLHSVADAILLFDTRGRLLLLNPAGEQLFTDYDAKLGMPLPNGYGYDTLIELLNETCTSGEPRTGEIVWPDQRVFAAQFTPSGKGGCVVLLHDISHFKTLERVKNEFISTASHDLKNPIATILGFSELLVRAGPLNETQAGFARRINSAAEHMSQLVQDLLDLARVDMGVELKKEIIDLNTLVFATADEYQPQAEAKKQILHVEKTQNQPVVEGDHLRLRQALRNLVGNAIKYTPADGSITLSVESRETAVIVSVRDTGYGIPSEDLPFVFDRFYRVHNEAVKDIEGNGLGLAIVKAIIEQHDGQIDVESKPGKGTCFSFALPLFQPEQSVVPVSGVMI
jgi:signal transduction histidine kinase/DNA-binding response OmpR family regulator